MDEKQAYEQARKYVEERVNFYVHLLIYLFVNCVFIFINYRYNRGYWWFYFPLLFWGIGLFAHFISVFLFSPMVKEHWIRKKAQELLKTYSRENNQ
ncbi:MAG: 2TM domain-containing protein [candidate division WOR-3 bacterium]|nr:2TM domain-containing protein [candidate division WOR-3 bacterium]